MWGSTEPSTAEECNWASYKYCNGSENTLTKYNTSSDYGENPDNITTLDTEDDTATQIMGSDWRMPTEAEFQELLSGTTNEWITNYNGTGANGWKFISKTDTSKYIFIPAAGYCSNGSVGSVGDYGYVWSSSLTTRIPYCAGFLRFDSSGHRNISSDEPRYYGRSVRGVRA